MFDWIVIITLVYLTLRGLLKGMISQIISVASYIVSWIVASRFSFMLAPSIPAEAPWDNIGAMVVIFIGTLIAIRLVHSVLERVIKALYLGSVNRIFGAGLGFVKGVLVCMILTFFGVMLSDWTRSFVLESKSGPKLARLIEQSGAFIPENTCELLKKQLDRFHAQLEGTGVDYLSDSDSSSESGLSSLLARGGKLLDDTKAFRDELKKTQDEASSLTDGISRWWNSWWNNDPETSEEETITAQSESKLDSDSEQKSEPIRTRSTFASASIEEDEVKVDSSSEAVQPVTVQANRSPSIPAQVVAESEHRSAIMIPSQSEEEMLLRRSALSGLSEAMQEHHPMASSPYPVQVQAQSQMQTQSVQAQSVQAQSVQAQAQASGTPQPVFASGPDPIAAQAMAVSQPKRRFYSPAPRRNTHYNSLQLLRSTQNKAQKTDSPATLFRSESM